MIFYDGTNSDMTFTAFKNRMSTRDAASFSELPPFIASPLNLHLKLVTPNQCESGGVRITSPIALTTDYDGDIRQGETGYTGTGVTPDIGADEGNFILIDLDAPSITYTLLGNACTTDNRILNATITDVSGIPVSGSLVPRIYYRKNSGSWYSQPGSLVSGTGLNGNWNFIIVASDLGGLAIGDAVSYYVIAQDLYSPFNIGANPSNGLVATNVNTVITPPTTPNTYTVLNSLTGIYQVGIGKPFETLTAAAAAYNNPTNCLGMNVTFELTDASYSTSETFPIVFNANPYAGPGNLLTIRPASGVTTTITGSSSSSLIKFNGARYIILDGSNSNGTDRNLFITNTYSSGSPVAVWVGSVGTGAGSTNITIRNCNLSTGSNTTNTSYGIFSGSSSTIGTAGDDNDNLIIRNNNIYKAKVGIYVQASATGVNDNLQIIQNNIGSSTSANYITNTGITISYASGATVSQNTIYNIISTSGIPNGLSIGTGVVSSAISKNYIRTVQTSSTASRGIYVNTGNSASNLTFSNNVLCEIIGSGTGTISSSNVGMFIDGATGGLNIYFNSMSLNGTYGIPSVFYTTAILFNTSTISAIDLRDNIFKNTYINLSNSSSKNYAIYSVAPATSFTNINYNDYYPTGSQGTIGYLGGNMTTLSAWQTATGKDANSVSTDPLFVSNYDLRPGGGALVLGSGVTIPGITDDYLDVIRSTNPTIGAYENGVDAIPPAISYTPLGNTVSTSGRSLNATITDASGVPTSGPGLPVLYWKINSGTWLPATGSALGGDVYQFNF